MLLLPNLKLTLRDGEGKRELSASDHVSIWDHFEILEAYDIEVKSYMYH